MYFTFSRLPNFSGFTKCIFQSLDCSRMCGPRAFVRRRRLFFLILSAGRGWNLFWARPSFKYNVCDLEETACYTDTSFCAKVNFDQDTLLKLKVDLLTQRTGELQKQPDLVFNQVSLFYLVSPFSPSSQSVSFLFLLSLVPFLFLLSFCLLCLEKGAKLSRTRNMSLRLRYL